MIDTIVVIDEERVVPQEVADGGVLLVPAPPAILQVLSDDPPAIIEMPQDIGPIILEDEPPPQIIEVGMQGPVGPKGDKGDKGDTGDVGPQGPPGAATPYYIHEQAVPSTTWHIVHPLNKRPSVSVVDSSGREAIGEIDWIDDSTVDVYFRVPFGGYAYLN